MRKTSFRLEGVSTAVLFFLSSGCAAHNGENAGGVSDLLRNEKWSSKPCPVVPDGMWHSSSGDWMKVEGNKVRIGRRGQSAYAELENRANGEVIFEQFDFAEKWPQRLRILRGGDIEYTRDIYRPWVNITDNATGSGVVIEDGLILTCAHCVADSSYIRVRKQNEDSLYHARAEFIDNDADLALVRVEDDAFMADMRIRRWMYDTKPDYFVYGGLVFSTASYDYMVHSKVSFHDDIHEDRQCARRPPA